MRLFLSALTLILAVAVPVAAQERPVILIGIDGFRADYLERGVTPTISRLAAEGVTAEGGMRASFPTVTFPNFFTLATGRHPDRHGLIYNAMTDARAPGRQFTLRNRAEVMDGFWYEAEPIWVTAERAGMTTATMFWPGSEAAIGGVRPRHWIPFEQTVPSAARVNIVLGWMTLPEAERPDLVTLYFDVVDTAGHRFGPGAPETDAALGQVDAAVALLLEGLAARGIEADLVIVADHGMAGISGERIAWLDERVDPSALTVRALGPVALLDPLPGREAEATAVVGEGPNLSCWARADVPARLAYGRNDRVPAYVCMARTGWVAGIRGQTDPARISGGAHGYDNEAPEMRALFVAHGPAFGRGLTLTGMDSVDVQPLLGRLLGLSVPAGDGRAEDTLPAMRVP
jgi:predicted AlkP superfamily pyrophosphatase or phosphodiesterase